MKKNRLDESLNKMKYLYEFHFKPHKNQESSIGSSEQSIDENPIKFDEVGDKYKQEVENDYPTFDQYKDEVIIDEDDPTAGEEEKQPEPVAEPAQQPVEPEPQQNTAPQEPVQQEVPPAPTPEPVAEPVQQPVAVPIQPEPDSLEVKLDAQISKTDQLLSSIESMFSKINKVENDVDEIKNPSYDAQLDMISKNSYPFNVKLSDYWNWDETEKPEEPEQYEISQDDIDSYDKEEIKKSLNI